MSSLTQTLSPAISFGLSMQLDIRHSLMEQRDDIKAQLDAVNEGIEAAMHSQGVEAVVVGDYSLKLSPVKGRETLDKLRLVELGVSTETLKAATKTGDPSYRLDVREVKR